MLGKLIKQEFRATGRILLPVMGAMLVLAGLANLSLRSMVNDVTQIRILRILMILTVVFFGLAVVVTIVMAVVIMVSRFYRNLLKDEGYLMFTLPVSVHELIWSKLLVSLVWFLVTGLLIWLLLMLTGLNLSQSNLEMILSELPSWKEILEFLDGYQIRGQLRVILIQILLIVFVGGLTTCLHFYAAMSLGHMFSQSKVLLSIVFYVAISIAFGIMSTGYGMAGMRISMENGISELEMEDLRSALQFFSSVMWHGILISTVQGVLLYVATALGLKRGLNLG